MFFDSLFYIIGREDVSKPRFTGTIRKPLEAIVPFSSYNLFYPLPELGIFEKRGYASFCYRRCGNIVSPVKTVSKSEIMIIDVIFN